MTKTASDTKNKGQKEQITSREKDKKSSCQKRANAKNKTAYDKKNKWEEEQVRRRASEKKSKWQIEQMTSRANDIDSKWEEEQGFKERMYKYQKKHSQMIW